MTDTTAATGKPRGDYGIDGSFHVVSARAQGLGIGVGSAALLLSAGASLARGKWRRAALAGAAGTAILGVTGHWIYVSRAGKFRVWDGILDGMRLHGDETLLDMGCGRGAILTAAAKRLPHGRAIGVDLWDADQTGNSERATVDNAILEGVADRVDVHTGDMTALPLGDNSVDTVISNLAIHNIPGREGRRRALSEAVRVLRPGGRLAIADLWDTRKHAAELRGLGWRDVQHRNLGWRMWFGGPWFATYLVTATKPG